MLQVKPGKHTIFTEPNALGSPVEFGFTEAFKAGEANILNTLPNKPTRVLSVCKRDGFKKV